MTKLRSEYYPTGGINHDIVGEYFSEVFETMNKPVNCLIEVKNYENSDTRLSIMWHENRVKAFVIETRTDFNNINIVKGEL